MLSCYVPQPTGCYYEGGSLKFNNNGNFGKCTSQDNCLCKYKCPGGKFQDQISQTSCKTCPTGTYSLAGKSSCPLRATSCPKGTYASGTATVCDFCGAGKYNDLTEQTSEASCKSCQGKFYKLVDIGPADCACETGQEPTSDQIACVPIGKQAIVHGERTSGKCTDGGGSIVTKEKCLEYENVVEWNRFKYGSVGYAMRLNATSLLPSGCFRNQITGNLHFNSDINSITPCSSSDFKCLCKIVCEPSTYQDQTSQTSCKPCIAGKYSMFGKSGCNYDVNTCPR